MLRVDAVSATADFFELGGQSLLATQAIGRLCDVLGRPVPLRSLFALPVLRDFAAALEAAAPAAERAEAPIPPCADAAREQLSFAQQRLWFLDQWMPGSALYSLPFAFRLEGPWRRPSWSRRSRPWWTGMSPCAPPSPEKAPPSSASPRTCP
ncbi:phosphopantetheine-binding protein [Corallococcus sp. 4LFB]|uniref:phosphopantetheine-binding protein n=1 Tax=Corallococcus sp. 4LFB TaxID=3383249 RepID=UPI0039760F6B